MFNRFTLSLALIPAALLWLSFDAQSAQDVTIHFVINSANKAEGIAVYVHDIATATATPKPTIVEFPTIAPTMPPNNGACVDTGADMVSCNNGKIIIASPNISNETPLPGCAGLPYSDPMKCRSTLSMTGEIYAIRFRFAEITGKLKNSEITIASITRDVMTTEQDRYKKFDMTISTIPGDFNGVNGSQYCSQRGYKDGTDLRINAKQITTASPQYDFDQCPLKPDTQYYINVKASAPGCADAGSKPVLCATVIEPRIPASVN